MKKRISLICCGLTACAMLPAVEPAVTLDSTPVKAGKPVYVPSLKFAAFPERLNAGTRKMVVGMEEFFPDTQKPSGDGIDIFGKTSSPFGDQHHGLFYHLNYLRSGMKMRNDTGVNLRMESYQLALLTFGVRADGKYYPFNLFQRKEMLVKPGEVIYSLYSPQLKLKVEMAATTLPSVPAYGGLFKLTMRSETERKIELFARLDERRAAFPQSAPTGEIKPGFVSYASPQQMRRVGPKAHADLFLHSTEYQVLLGFDGESATLGDVAVRNLTLNPGVVQTVYCAMIVDSPNAASGAEQQIADWMKRNPNLPEDVRKDLTEKAMRTYVRNVVNGDKVFPEILKKAPETFERSLAMWQKGLYRPEKVAFAFPDAKMTNFINLMVNDYYPSIVSEPGLVHNIRSGDFWNYIFCYRHVHGAANLGLETAAADYLKILSPNQIPRITSFLINFKSNGHATRFDESYVDSLYQYYRWTGDLKTVEQLYPTVVKALEFLDKDQDANNDNLYLDFLNQWKSDFDHRGPSSSFMTSLVWRAYRDAAFFAEKLGKKEDAAKFTAKAAAIHTAMQKELWNDEFAMLGPKCPNGLLRLHPQSLEVEIPIWTGAVDPYQAEMLMDWYYANLAMFDKQGGLWMYDNDWWPMVWSQHVASPGDSMMVAWAMFLTGRHEEGYKLLKSLSHASYRTQTPGFGYYFFKDGTFNRGVDPATSLGAMSRALVEGMFGVKPELDEKRIVVTPRIPASVAETAFSRPGLAINYRAANNLRTLTVKTASDVTPVIHLPVDSEVKSVTLDGKAATYKLAPSMRFAMVELSLPPGGGTLAVETAPKSWSIQAPATLKIGEKPEIKADGLDFFQIEDRYQFLDKEGRLAKLGSGRAVLFAACKKGNIEWTEPIGMTVVSPELDKWSKRTCVDPLPADGEYVTLDLAKAYNADIQTCFKTKWAYDVPQFQAFYGADLIKFWTMPLFVLKETLPREIKVGAVPFQIGPMGPGLEKENDLIMLANVPQSKLPTTAKIDFEPRNLYKVQLLSLNMMLPMKAYTPIARVTVRYADGSSMVTPLIPPFNADCHYQDFGVNTLAWPLPAKAGYGRKWNHHGNMNLSQIHLTMTDVICDPVKKVVGITAEAVATECFYAIAGITLEAKK